MVPFRLDYDDTPTPPNNATSRSMMGGGKIPNTYPDVYSAAEDESYELWVRSVECWIAGEGGQMPRFIIGPRVLSRLKGRAAVICRGISPEQAAQDDGWEIIQAKMKSSPLLRELIN